MNIPMCAVYDKQTGFYDAPFTTRHIAEASREWQIVKSNDKTKYGKTPQDFELRKIADYNQDTGEVIPVKPHICIE